MPKNNQKLNITIYRCSKPNYWYAHHIGKSYRVYHAGSHYTVIDNNRAVAKHIELVDAIIPEEYKGEKLNQKISQMSNHELHREVLKFLKCFAAHKKTIKKLDELYKRAEKNENKDR